jgi:hypothetical protein
MPPLAPFPETFAYVMAHACSRCGAQPDEVCNAPRKLAHLVGINRLRARFDLEPAEHHLLSLFHAPRVDVGQRHKGKDIGTAPWPEERIPGLRYDTLPASDFELHALHRRLTLITQQVAVPERDGEDR